MARIKKPLEIDLDLVGSGLTHARGHLQVSKVSLARDVHCPAGSAVGPLQEAARHGEHLDESPRTRKLVDSRLFNGSNHRDRPAVKFPHKDDNFGILQVVLAPRRLELFT